MRHRSPFPLIAFTLSFTGCILFAYCWFNTDIGRPQSRDQKSEIRDQESGLTSDLRPLTSGTDLRPPSSGIWLSARTNLPGYTFVEEPVTDEVKKILGTTNILNGTFHRISEVRSQKSEVRARNRRSAVSPDF